MRPGEDTKTSQSAPTAHQESRGASVNTPRAPSTLLPAARYTSQRMPTRMNVGMPISVWKTWALRVVRATVRASTGSSDPAPRASISEPMRGWE